MKISVVTACLNAEKTIAHTIRSFLLQDYPEKEMLIIDGNSTDKTATIVKSFERSEIQFIQGTDSGPYDAMNKGLRLFRGDAVGFLNSDDAFHDSAALTKIAAGLSNSDTVHGDLRIISDHVTKRVMRQWTAGPYKVDQFKRGWMPPHPTFYIQRHVAQAVGAFDLRYRISADYDFMLRALEIHKARSNYIPSLLVDFMVGGLSTRGLLAVVKSNLECLASRQRHLGAGFVDMPLLTKPAKKLLQIRF